MGGFDLASRGSAQKRLHAHGILRPFVQETSYVQHLSHTHCCRLGLTFTLLQAALEM